MPTLLQLSISSLLFISWIIPGISWEPQVLLYSSITSSTRRHESPSIIQIITFYFGPSADMPYIQMSVNQQKIKEALTQITKIDSWSYGEGSSVLEGNTFTYQPRIQYEITVTDDTIPKLNSLVQLLEYDNTETFKTLFNELMENNGEYNIYMTQVEGYEGWNDGVLEQYNYLKISPIFDETMYVQAVGGGVLYAEDAAGFKTFCNDTVCFSVRFKNAFFTF